MQKLFTEFNHTTAQQWKEQLVKDLKGIDFDSLVSKTNEGIDINPFYTPENSSQKREPIFAHNDWAICERIVVNDEKTANQQALDALSNGASGLVFIIDEKIDSAILLKGILLQHIYTLFKVQPIYVAELQNALQAINTGDTCFISTDVIASVCETGNWVMSQDEDFKLINNQSVVYVNGSMYQEAGANATNELSFIVSHLNEYFNYYANSNSLAQLKKIHVTVSVGGNFFMEIAKLRALRQLISFMCKQYELNLPVHIHGQTTSINKSHLDSYTNLLRSTTEAMSASIGGCNSITVLPYDANFNPASDFSLRMARNQQLILKEESYLNKVADMAAGSYYIESLTNDLCNKAWEAFKAIETKGGFIESLKQNSIQHTIENDTSVLQQQLLDGALVLVGVNKYKNENEVVPVIPTNTMEQHTVTTVKPINKLVLG